jgi:hypothetical protein
MRNILYPISCAHIRCIVGIPWNRRSVRCFGSGSRGNLFSYSAIPFHRFIYLVLNKPSDYLFTSCMLPMPVFANRHVGRFVIYFQMLEDRVEQSLVLRNSTKLVVFVNIMSIVCIENLHSFLVCIQCL